MTVKQLKNKIFPIPKQAVLCDTQVAVLVVAHIVIDAHQEVAILVAASLDAALLGILLQCPDAPQEHVGVLHLIYLAVTYLAIHKVIDGNGGCLHNSLELIDMSL